MLCFRHPTIHKPGKSANELHEIRKSLNNLLGPFNSQFSGLNPRQATVSPTVQACNATTPISSESNAMPLIKILGSLVEIPYCKGMLLIPSFQVNLSAVRCSELSKYRQ
ncbi:hypothetical protein MLD38_013373 [Melastoma candidum]|uniref:Uncharacterized protein n=1 Tax=Melastoma candidum TaxID=119954 RepID=A0ACB9RDJ5_9MYRT|nr:hypothetical protein MLD38_013373 [Melastoma candidum]